MSQKPKIFLIEELPIMLSGLQAILTSNDQFEVVGFVHSRSEALESIKRTKPDIVLIGLSGLTATGTTILRNIQKEIAGIKILVLSMQTEEEYIIKLIRAGAHGYFLKDCMPAELLFAVETINRGEAYFSPALSKILLRRLNPSKENINKKRIDTLSSRETEVLQLIAEGLSNKKIADRLYITVRTVETHRERIIRKLNIHNTAGLTKYAVSKGIISL
jgi:DNA-binding NarL/FixJ family response regulator